MSSHVFHESLLHNLEDIFHLLELTMDLEKTNCNTTLVKESVKCFQVTVILPARIYFD